MHWSYVFLVLTHWYANETDQEQEIHLCLSKIHFSSAIVFNKSFFRQILTVDTPGLALTVKLMQGQTFSPVK